MVSALINDNDVIMTQCPVCNKNGLSADLQSCPQCNADLECFQLLDNLLEPDNYNTPQHKQSPVLPEMFDEVSVNKENNSNRLYLLVLIIICILLVGQTFYFSFYFKKQFMQSEKKLKNELSLLSKQLQNSIKTQSDAAKPVIVTRSDNTALQGIDNKITAMAETFSTELSDIKNNISLLSGAEDIVVNREQQPIAKPADETDNNNHDTEEMLPEDLPDELFETQHQRQIIVYQSSKEDTLWSIAKKFYGSGIYYPVILKMNPGLSLKNHLHYGKIKLFKQYKDMLEYYKEIHQPVNSNGLKHNTQYHE